MSHLRQVNFILYRTNFFSSTNFEGFGHLILEFYPVSGNCSHVKKFNSLSAPPPHPHFSVKLVVPIDLRHGLESVIKVCVHFSGHLHGVWPSKGAWRKWIRRKKANASPLAPKPPLSNRIRSPDSDNPPVSCQPLIAHV